MKKIFLLFVLFSSLIWAIENRTEEVGLSIKLSNAMSSFLNTKSFQEYALCIVRIKKIYKSLEKIKNYKEILQKNPLVSSKIIFEKLELSKYNLLDQWKESVLTNKPKNISPKKVKEVEKLMSEVDRMFRPMLTDIYKKLEVVIMNPSTKNIEAYKFYISKLKESSQKDNEVQSIVAILLSMVVSSPDIYIKTYQEHQVLENKYEALISTNNKRKNKWEYTPVVQQH